MLSYEGFFLIILISILGPVVGVLIMIFHSQMEKQRNYLEMQNRQVILEKELQESQYQQLTQQIEPHFLFNALNSLLGLIRLRRHEQLQPAFENVVRFLHYKYRTMEQLVPILEEVTHTQNYLAIQQLRFGTLLQIHWDIDSPLEDLKVPPYFLQTLVENAFKHGLERTEEVPVLRVQIRCDEQLVLLCVEDNGPGFMEDPFNSSSSKGIGLKNIERRLKLLFGEQAQLLAQNAPTGGAQVTISWPNRRKEGGVNNERIVIGR